MYGGMSALFSDNEFMFYGRAWRVRAADTRFQCKHLQHRGHMLCVIHAIVRSSLNDY